MKTAVEWFVEEMFKQGYFNDKPLTVNSIEYFVKQANKIFEEQIMDANEEGFHSGQSMAHNGTCFFESPKDYYNKTFKSE
jgi:hypothetical protein